MRTCHSQNRIAVVTVLPERPTAGPFVCQKRSGWAWCCFTFSDLAECRISSAEVTPRKGVGSHGGQGVACLVRRCPGVVTHRVRLRVARTDDEAHRLPGAQQSDLLSALGR